jgi:hypothetical protein
LDEQPLRTVFTGFEMALGPVGAAKPRSTAVILALVLNASAG